MFGALVSSVSVCWSSFVEGLHFLVDPLYGRNFLVQVFKHYFEELEEESLRDNFVVVVRGIFSLLKQYWYSRD